MDDTELYADLDVDDTDQQEAKTLDLDDDTQRYLDLEIEDVVNVIEKGDPTPTPTTSAIVSMDAEGNLTGTLEAIPAYFFNHTSNTASYDRSGFIKAIKTAKFEKATSVGDYGFSNCSSLTSIDLPVCTSIEVCGLSGCSALTSLVLPACESLGQEALKNCNRLTTIDLPVCTSLGTYVFGGGSAPCTTLILRNPNKVASLADWTSLPKNCKVYVPDDLVDRYKTATNWKDYASKITPLSELPA